MRSYKMYSPLCSSVNSHVWSTIWDAVDSRLKRQPVVFPLRRTLHHSLTPVAYSQDLSNSATLFRVTRKNRFSDGLVSGNAFARFKEIGPVEPCAPACWPSSC